MTRLTHHANPAMIARTAAGGFCKVVRMSQNAAIHRDIGRFALMLTGPGSVIGSVWLFGAWKAAGLAGPGAVRAWVIGALVITVIALTIAELGAMFPESGGMERNGTLPKILGTVHSRWGVPRPAMWLNLAVSFPFLFFFRGWDSLAAVISVATIISRLTGPVSVMTLRRTAAHLQRPYHLTGPPVIAGIAFIMSAERLYWIKWPLTDEIIRPMVVAPPVYLYYQAKSGWHDFRRQRNGA